MTAKPPNYFRYIVDSYMPAATILGLTRDEVDMAVRRATRFMGTCVSCRFSRAPSDAEEIARDDGYLPVYLRRCTLLPIRTRCKRYARLEPPIEVITPNPTMAASSDYLGREAK